MYCAACNVLLQVLEGERNDLEQWVAPRNQENPQINPPGAPPGCHYVALAPGQTLVQRDRATPDLTASNNSDVHAIGRLQHTFV